MKNSFDHLVKTLLAQQTLSEKKEEQNDDEEEEDECGCGGVNIDTEDGQGESSR